MGILVKEDLSVSEDSQGKVVIVARSCRIRLWVKCDLIDLMTPAMGPVELMVEKEMT